jgi:hypothetical protein
MFEVSQRHRSRPRRLGDRRSPRGARRRAARGRRARRCSASRHGHRGRRRGGRPGPWVAHVSGATPLPRSTRTRAGSGCTRCRRSRASRGPSSSTARGRRSPRRPRGAGARHELARTLGLQPFDLDDEARPALPRGRGDRVQLPRDAARRRRACSSRRRAPGGARAADDPDGSRTGSSSPARSRAATGNTVDATCAHPRKEEPSSSRSYVALAEATRPVRIIRTWRENAGRAPDAASVGLVADYGRAPCQGTCRCSRRARYENDVVVGKPVP